MSDGPPRGQKGSAERGPDPSERKRPILVPTPVPSPPLPVPKHAKHQRAYRARNPGCKTPACDHRVWRWFAAYYEAGEDRQEEERSSTRSESSSYSSSGSLPACTWVPESGGDWHAVNSSSGAGGRYQILPSTWAAYGGQGEPQNAPPAEQTRVAERIMAGQGPSAWVNC